MMNELLEIPTITAYNEYIGMPTRHPLITIVDFAHSKPLHRQRTMFGFYALFFKDRTCGEIRYGRGKYDYSEGALVSMGPHQVFNIDAKGEEFQPEGVGLLFHPDLIIGTELAKNIRQYTFFSYEMNEALHLSPEERTILDDCISKIRTELERPLDRFSKKLIVGNLEMLLDYCLRFFDRQFTTRKVVNRDLLAKFEAFLNDYMHSGKAEENGVPNVTLCADAMQLSPNYFSDLIRKETGQSALDMIHDTVASVAKEMIFDGTMSLSDIAYRLGFKYPQHFSRMFKRITGLTPLQFRTSISAR